MPVVTRYDRAQIDKPTYLDNGWVRIQQAPIARAGLLEYTRADGSKWVEYRPPTAHTDATIATFDAVPFTNNHPPAGLLNADNTKLYQVGTVLNPKVDGDKLNASILITDSATVEAIRNGKVELSCGYSADVDATPGITPDGRHYDAIQSNIQGNHVALVSKGRAGPEIRLRLDSNESVVSFPTTSHPEGKPMTTKVRIDSVEYEVSETVASAISKLDAQLQSAQNEVKTEKERTDAAKAEVTSLKKELAEAPEKVRVAMLARVALENQAKSVLGAEAKLDGKTDIDVKREVATKAGFKLDGKADSFVEAAFEIALEKAIDVKKVEDVRATTAPMPGARQDDKLPLTADAAQANYVRKMQNAHRAHLENK